MGKVILYTATSLDGFIARPDGNLDWLTSIPNPATGDYGYEDPLSSIETIIMGRKTYDEVIGFGIEWPYVGFKTYIVTTDVHYTPKSVDTYILNSNLKDFIHETKKISKKDIWLVGGGKLTTSFINHGLVDRMIITIIPKVISEGIPLFAPKPAESNWSLIKVQQFNTGVVNLTYDKAE